MGHSLLCLLGLFLLSTVIHGNTEELGVKPTLTADRLTIPAGGSVTLTCDVKHSADFEYEWFREPSLNTEKTAVVGESKRELVTSEGGIYNCRGRIKGTNSITVESDPVIIQETGHGVNITVTADSTTIPAGGSVTLTCDVKHSADLKYEWVRETSSAVKSTETVGSDKVIKISKGGKYQCRGWRTDITSLIAQSDPVIIQETVSNRIDVTLQHSWSQIFTGETITLRCEIQGGEGKVWKYEWTAPNTNSPPTSSEYRISRVSLSHSGDYRCRGSSDYLLTGWSDAFRLTVSYKPKAKLRADNTTVPVGGSVTLTCSVNPSSSSSGWKYYWYRDDTTVDVVSPSNGQISVSLEGLYRCRGGRGNPVYYTEDSQEVQINTTVTVSGADSSSSPVWLIVRLVCGVSLIIILLLLLYRCRRTNSAANEQTLNQDEDQQQVYSSLLHGDRCVYETVRRCENTENDYYFRSSRR
ncbi:leukocyte immunoglobulin-like receptor subfamily A member 3 isoform X3 [Oreochromis niloticus]|uniref:leukocyte immunoglobulin-like receptor subfamily A member 3 isoform X3 n=1 Tax=Oreochromis niloticus TaxID=8128 RepID=UPI000DF1C0D6|nr:leukocyte immunoglobulin-like receptor subfamily A member 3 isoform X3 [Oreochromis niloticus]